MSGSVVHHVVQSRKKIVGFQFLPYASFVVTLHTQAPARSEEDCVDVTLEKQLLPDKSGPERPKAKSGGTSAS